MSTADIGTKITFSGAANAVNNGAFTITGVPSATQVTITNTAAVGTDANNGNISWTIATTAVALPDSSTLWPSMSTYDEAILPCGGQTSDVATLGGTGKTAQQTDVYNWLKAGGRLFGDHWSASGLLVPTTSGGNAVAPWNTTSTFQGTFQSAPGSSMSGRVAPGGGARLPSRTSGPGSRTKARTRAAGS